jgi:hypothetical protein
VTREPVWRNLHNEELLNLYSSPNIIRVNNSKRIEWTGHVARMGKREIHRVVWLESQKRPYRHMQKDNNKTDLREIGWGGINWINMA